jgi:hypothetical protein
MWLLEVARSLYVVKNERDKKRKGKNSYSQTVTKGKDSNKDDESSP